MANDNKIQYKQREWFNFSDLKGKRLGGFKRLTHDGNDALLFADLEGNVYLMTHNQDCCKNVWLEDVSGSWDDIEWQEVLEAYETSESMPEKDYGTGTWTFYTLVAFNGSVTLRWCGESNGYYSEGVDFYQIIF